MSISINQFKIKNDHNQEIPDSTNSISSPKKTYGPTHEITEKDKSRITGFFP